MNGLQSLMQGAPRQPQPQQAPAMPPQNDPRMAAAMDVVKADVPESLQNLVDESEFAKKAMELLQSAGGQAAMNQPAPTAPTVADRVNQSAQEGVTGLMQRLAPGMQQRGRQVQQAQARKMLGGGMPTMGAPNMRRMAMGGIVGYAGPDGSKVEAMAPQTPMAGQTQNPSPGYLDPAVATFLRELEKLNKQLEGAFPQEKDLFEQKITDLLNTTSPRVKRIASDSQFGLPKKDGMAMGGEVKRFQAGMEVELDEDLIASLLAQRPEATGYTGPSAEERRAASEAALAQARDARRAEERTRQELRERGLSGPAINRYLSSRLDAVEPGGIAELKQLQFDTRSPQTGPFPAPATEFMPEGSSAMGKAGQPTTAEGLLGVLAQQTETAANVDTVDSPISQMLRTRLNAAPDNEGALTQATTLREAETKLAESAYEMSPELKAAYAAAKAKEDEYYKAQLDPKRLRSKKFDELLTGFATPGGIARSGIAALKGTTGVDDAALEMQRQRGVEDFARTKEQAGIEREGRVKAYEGGRGAFNTAFDRLSGQATQALQTLGAMANSEQTRAQTERLANDKNQLDLTKARLDSIFQQGRLDEQSRATAVRLLDSQSRRLIDFRKQLSEILDTLGTPEEKAALLKENEGYIQSQVEVVNAARATLGMPTMPLVQTSTGGGETGSTGDPELDKLLQQY